MNQITIGRASENNIHLSHPSVSNFHAVIEQVGTNQWMLRDLDSTNGTYVNGKRIHAPTLLNIGDEVMIDQYAIQWHQHINSNSQHRTQAAFTQILIGRDEGSDWVFNHAEVSHHHASLTKMNNGTISLEDLNSTNGTYVNGQLIQKTQLRPGDQVLLASIYPLDWESRLGLPVSPPNHGHGTQVLNLPQAPTQAISTNKILGIVLGILFLLGIVGYFLFRTPENEIDPEVPIDTLAIEKPDTIIEEVKEPEGPKELKDLVADLENSVVLIILLDANQNFAGSGSGFFVGENMIISNYHVVPAAQNDFAYVVVKTLSGDVETISAKEIRINSVYSKNLDYIIFPVKELSEKPIPMADKMPQKGEDVFVIGNPGTAAGILESSVTRGIVSGIRAGDSQIQMDAAITSGNSGGPVINMKGEAIGIATLKILDCENCNFALSILAVRRELDRLN